MKNQILAEVVYLTPAQVREQFPNALMATANKELVERTERRAGHKIAVHYFDAAWGRTVLKMEAA